MFYDPGSYRDPSGRVLVSDDRIFREGTLTVME